MAKTKKQRRADWGDPKFEGRGKLLCKLCSVPLVKHPLMQPCPFPFNPLNRDAPVR